MITFFCFGSKLSLISANIVNTYSLFRLYLSINSYFFFEKRVLSVPNHLFPFYQSFHNIYHIYVINVIVHVYLIIYLNLPYTWFRVELNT